MAGMISKSKVLTAIGLVLVMVSGGVGWVTVKILTRPGPRQEELARQEAERRAMSAEQKKMEEMKAKRDELTEIVKTIPQFEPPRDEIVPPDRWAKYADIRYAIVTAMAEERKTYPTPPFTLPQAFLLASRMTLVVEGTQMKKMIENRMTEDEYNWIDNKFYEAAVVALTRLEALTGDPKARETVHSYAAFAAETLGLYDTNEKGRNIGRPDKFDQSTVPPQHVKYVMQYYKKLGSDQLWINKLDWTPLLKAEGVTPM